MPTTQSSFKRIHFQTIGSTQDYLSENAMSLLSDTNQIVVTADEQTKGRGTANRLWASPPQVNIYATFAIKIPNEFTTYFDLVKSPAVMEMMALAVAKTLEEMGLKPVIKWRNDILINGKKICGILCEPIITSQGGVGLIGIGLNVNMPKEICDSLDQPVTSMAVEMKQHFDKEQVFNLLAKNVDHYINLYVQNKFSDCVPEINLRLAFIGKLIHVEDLFSKKIIEGICLGIDEIGQIKIQGEDNNIQYVKWGRIIKDELTYPEAFKKNQKNENHLKTNYQSILLGTSGALGIAGLFYLLVNKYHAEKKTSSPNASDHKSTMNTPGKRYYSTTSQSNKSFFTPAFKPKYQPKEKLLPTTFFIKPHPNKGLQPTSLIKAVTTGIKMLKP